MTSLELKEVVDQRKEDPSVLGRLACNLHSSDLVEQWHHDNRLLTVVWRDTGDFWRCTVFLDEKVDLKLVQADIHDNGTVRVETFEPCRVTLSPEDGLLSVTRYKRP
jgi:hypothetical protein